MADQDRFIVQITGVGVPRYGHNSDIAILLAVQSQLNITHFDYSDYNGPFGSDNYADGDGAELINLTTDDVFQGNAANLQTVKDQIDTVMVSYYDRWQSSITGQQIIPAHPVVNVNPNGTVNVTPHAPASPNPHSNDPKATVKKTSAIAGILGISTGALLAVAVVVGFVVLDKKNQGL